ncbi:pentapeptide repeat-containing protein [Kocuria dechangensis]|uniref:pentapeptide repeat-containing protein n=1 Tax=Kocuria dechangensis TaxID=1176249 RepID=UPI00166A3C3C|nr:pentapeptide repeat-containing protein [Kocuria dechangensis]
MLTAREAVVGFISATLVAVLTVISQMAIDDRREDEADRRENLRFIREQAADGKADKVSFRGIDLTGQNLSGLDLRHGDLEGAILKDADLTGTDLRNANLHGADLRSTTMKLTHLESAVLTDAMLQRANLLDVTMDGAVFDGADMRKSSWSFFNAGQVSLFETDLSDAEIAGVDMTHATIHETKLLGADLRGAQLPQEANFSRYFLSACFDEDTRWPPGYRTQAIIKGSCDYSG